MDKVETTNEDVHLKFTKAGLVIMSALGTIIITLGGAWLSMADRMWDQHQANQEQFQARAEKQFDHIVTITMDVKALAISQDRTEKDVSEIKGTVERMYKNVNELCDASERYWEGHECSK